MKVELINPPALERSDALTQGTRAGDWIFVSGQRARDTSGQTVGVGDFETQAERAFECVAQVLAEAGADLSDVVKLTAYLVSPLHVERFHDICARVFPTHPPAGTTAVVASLTSPDALIEIEACARLGQNSKRLTQRTGPFSTSVRTGNTIFVSGQTAASRQGQEPPTDFQSQLHSVYQNLDASLTEFGAGFSDLVKINYFITNPLYYRELYRIREEVFEVDWPGDSVVSVRALDDPKPWSKETQSPLPLLQRPSSSTPLTCRPPSTSATWSSPTASPTSQARSPETRTKTWCFRETSTPSLDRPSRTLKQPSTP